MEDSISHPCTVAIPANIRQERTGAETEEASAVGLSAVQQVKNAFGVPVQCVVTLSHLMEFMAAKGDTGGADAEVWPMGDAYSASS